MKDKIKQIRNSLQLTQNEFCSKIGISRSALTKLEAGITEPAGTTIMMIVKEFNVNESWLRTGEGEMFRRITPEEELAKWFADLSRLPLTSTQRRFAKMLTMLDPEDWQTIEKMMKAMIESYKEE